MLAGVAEAARRVRLSKDRPQVDDAPDKVEHPAQAARGYAASACDQRAGSIPFGTRSSEWSCPRASTMIMAMKPAAESESNPPA
jgi:hypothetical protein